MSSSPSGWGVRVDENMLAPLVIRPRPVAQARRQDHPGAGDLVVAAPRSPTSTMRSPTGTPAARRGHERDRRHDDQESFHTQTPSVARGPDRRAAGDVDPRRVHVLPRRGRSGVRRDLHLRGDPRGRGLRPGVVVHRRHGRWQHADQRGRRPPTHWGRTLFPFDHPIEVPSGRRSRSSSLPAVDPGELRVLLVGEDADRPLEEHDVARHRQKH